MYFSEKQILFIISSNLINKKASSKLALDTCTTQQPILSSGIKCFKHNDLQLCSEKQL